MKAKATTSYPIMAFGGVEFVKYEWRAVPAGFEDAAMAHPNLEVRQPEPEPVEDAHIDDVLPDDFPGKVALESVGIIYVDDVPNDLDSLTTIPGIGKATADKILSAKKEE